MVDNENFSMTLVQGPDGVWRKKAEPYATIECMTEEDYETFKRLIERGRDAEWCDAEVELPADPDEVVLVVVSGKYRNITFKHALELARYSSEEGWIMEHYPLWVIPQVSHWTSLPELPEELKEESQNERS